MFIGTVNVANGLQLTGNMWRFPMNHVLRFIGQMGVYVYCEKPREADTLQPLRERFRQKEGSLKESLGLSRMGFCAMDLAQSSTVGPGPAADMTQNPSEHLQEPN
ncbi:hypothetical protein TNCV_374241 [Trichonephila clavipes]|nr:hypothetical protein TNCV_374241 [Trichonephila clavipes]